MPRTINEWFDAYGHSHQNHVNEVIHWVCVPLIAFSLIALLHALPTGPLATLVPWFDWAMVLVFFALVFYVRLSLSITIGMLILAGIALAIILNWGHFMPWPLWPIAIGIFVFAWIAQFIGHRIEGEKPSFLEDIQFLLVGPAWLLSKVYRKFGIPF
ncbi:MAG: hypothetical protein CMJ23_10885 [Phycisphaerae bacterium]|nr:hypothetical protein [Phycisphaerae bacterium]